MSHPPLSRAQQDDCQLTLACPECGAGGRIPWKLLGNALKCHKCHCEFFVERGGAVTPVDDLPQTRFNCPRCRKSGRMATPIVARGAKCPDCRLPLRLGPDGRVHTAEQAAEMLREAARRGPGAWDLHLQKLRAIVDQPAAYKGTLTIGGAALLVAVLFLGSWVWSLFDFSPQARARRFVTTCLAGDWEAAEEYIGDDAVQRVEFERWRLRHFTSILDTYRPSGDRVSIDVELVSEAPTELVMLVKLRSEFFGTRSHVEHWRRWEGEWMFEALATLAAEDNRAGSRRGAPSRAVTTPGRR